MRLERFFINSSVTFGSRDFIKPSTNATCLASESCESCLFSSLNLTIESCCVSVSHFPEAFCWLILSCTSLTERCQYFDVSIKSSPRSSKRCPIWESENPFFIIPLTALEINPAGLSANFLRSLLLITPMFRSSLIALSPPFHLDFPVCLSFTNSASL